MSKIVPDTPIPPLQQFLNTIPSPLTTVLVGLAPYVSRIRHLSEVISWKSPWEESWIAIALWWAACLLGDVALRYVLPLAMLLILLVARWTTKPHAPASPITEDSLQQTISDLITIHALLPRLPPTPTTVLPVLLRISAILYIPYLILTHLIKLRVLLAILGTVFLTWRARWAAIIRRGLWRSAYIRWATYRLWAFLSGQPLPPPTLSPQAQAIPISAPSPTSRSDAPTSSSSNKDHSPTVNTFRFLFTVYENQRWWMGLDFTAALLPGERPSWCSANHQPVAPPSMFALPAPTTVYMRQGEGRVKRIARWRWEEEEWKVVIHKEGSSLSRVERPIPSPESEHSGSTGSANRILKAAGKMRQASLSGSASGRDGSPERHREDPYLHSSEGGAKGGADKGKDQALEDMYTDLDGWVYGDNKWEGGSSKGGMGKYTRYRRWTRIAVLSETVEPAEEGGIGIRKDGEESSGVDLDSDSSTVDLHTPPIPPSAHAKEDSEASSYYELSPIEDERSRLRQRLQAVVKGSSSASASHS